MGLFNLAGFLLCLAFLPPTKDKSLRTRARTLLTYMILIKDRPLGGLFVFRLVYTACIGIVWGFLPLFADMEFHLSGSLIGVAATLVLTRDFPSPAKGSV
ncbi:MAG: hypothetical protein DRG87_12400 [Deltaproteobacteria bacterium]|nr:MAG: hypothetical protein DRG87_12400 [Deltaproteobacteria bacterium]